MFTPALKNIYKPRQAPASLLNHFYECQLLIRLAKSVRDAKFEDCVKKRPREILLLAPRISRGRFFTQSSNFASRTD